MISKSAKVRKGVLIVVALAFIAGILALLPPIEVRDKDASFGAWHRSMDQFGGSISITAISFYGMKYVSPFVRAAFDGRQLVVSAWYRYSWFRRLREPFRTVVPVGSLKSGRYGIQALDSNGTTQRVGEFLVMRDPIVILPLHGAHDGEMRREIASRFESEWRVDASKVYVGKYVSQVFPDCPAYYAEYDTPSPEGTWTDQAREYSGIAIEIGNTLYYPTLDHPKDLARALHTCSYLPRTRPEVVRLLGRLVREWSCELESVVSSPLEAMHVGGYDLSEYREVFSPRTTPVGDGYQIVVCIVGGSDLSYLAGRMQIRKYLYKNGTFLRQ